MDHRIKFFGQNFFEFESESEEDTINCSSFFFSNFITKGRIFLLDGFLGSGKTTFLKGLSLVFDISEDQITSPSFNIIRQYQGSSNRMLYHIDLYRLEREEEFEELGLDELLISPSSFIFIEWANKFPDYLELTFSSENIWKIHFLLLEGKLNIQFKLEEKNNVLSCF